MDVQRPSTPLAAHPAPPDPRDPAPISTAPSPQASENVDRAMTPVPTRVQQVSDGTIDTQRTSSEVDQVMTPIPDPIEPVSSGAAHEPHAAEDVDQIMAPTETVPKEPIAVEAPSKQAGNGTIIAPEVSIPAATKSVATSTAQQTHAGQAPLSNPEEPRRVRFGSHDEVRIISPIHSSESSEGSRTTRSIPDTAKTPQDPLQSTSGPSTGPQLIQPPPVLATRSPSTPERYSEARKSKTLDNLLRLLNWNLADLEGALILMDLPTARGAGRSPATPHASTIPATVVAPSQFSTKLIKLVPRSSKIDLRPEQRSESLVPVTELVNSQPVNLSERYAYRPFFADNRVRSWHPSASAADWQQPYLVSSDSDQ